MSEILLKDGSYLDVTISGFHKKIEILRIKDNKSTSVIVLTRNEVKALGERLLKAYEGSKWNIEQGHIFDE